MSTAKMNIQLAFSMNFIHNLPIKQSESTKYLGVEFDNKLNFDKYNIY